MSLDIGDALRDGFGRLRARNGLVLTGVFVGFGIVNAVVQQSLGRVQFERFMASGVFDRVFRETSLSPDQLRGLMAGSTPLAYLDSLSLPALVGIALLFAVVAETIRIVAVRTFVSDETDAIPRELVSRNIGWAVLNGIVGGVVVFVLVAVGLVLLVIPGVFLAVAFFFVRQEIAVEDKNFVEAMSDSWGLIAGHRIEVFGLAVFLIVLGFAATFATGLVTSGGSAPGALLDAVVNAAVLAYSVAVASRAYDQLRDGREAADDELEGVDPELLP